MSKSTISTFELFRMFPDQESARVYFTHRHVQVGSFQDYKVVNSKGKTIYHRPRIRVH